MRTALLFLLVLSICVAATGVAGEAWIVQGWGASAPGERCESVLWVGTTFAWNSASTPSEVTILGFSNMDFVPIDNVVTVPPNHVIDFRDVSSVWSSGGFGGPVWIEHLSYPEDRIKLSASIELWEDNSCVPGELPLPGPRRGRIAMPIATSLAPANAPQRHFPVDLGGLQSRFNIGVYNGGAASGTGRIEIRAACDDALLVGADITLPANGFQQYSFPAPEEGGQCVGLTNSEWLLYASVVFDQPSLSYVSTIRDGVQIMVPDTIVGP